eukprot:Hpha_TRINITY_DN16212_c1_g3::TRINITY_DN16212_c1_g3_i1::g.13095::m.13095/K11583/PPP2R3; serine/threonine-protein phosphatase 2A regulatory subunit B''
MAAAVLNGALGPRGKAGVQRSAGLQAARAKIGELFVTWASLPDTQEVITRLSRQVQDKGRLSAAEIRALLWEDSAFERRSPVDPGHLDVSNWPSPPRSPRHSPSRVPVRQGPQLRADEIDFMRHGPASPAASPRQHAGGRSPVHGAGPRPEGAVLLALPTQAFRGSEAADGKTRHGEPSPPGEPKQVTEVAPRTHLTEGGRRLTGEQRVAVGQFFFPAGKPPGREVFEKEEVTLRKMFEGKKSGKPGQAPRGQSGRKLSAGSAGLDRTYTQKAFAELVTKVCLLPRWLSNIVFRRVLCWEPAPQNFDRDKEEEWKAPGKISNAAVGYQRFRDFYEAEMAGKTKELRLFDMIKWDRTRSFIIRDDLKPIVEEVLLVHPGLEFLKNTPDFQERYAETVQIRILFCANTKDDGQLTWPEFQRSSLPTVLHVLDAESDINVSHRTEYFSYEHFYVLYCKFWELDTDHDFLISKEDLSKYGNYSLTNAIIDRVFAGKGRRITSKSPQRMSYEDFVWFCLCEEDKGTPQALEYWFRCCDLDDDGFLSGYELKHFFQEQKERMESSYQEPIAYEDILCQMMDMIHPRDPKAIRLADLKACKLSGNLFNALFNLNKFIAFEQRDPFVTHAEKQLPEKTDWDRFAKVEYERMSLEAGEQEDGMQIDDG